MLITDGSEETVLIKILYVTYSIRFHQDKIWALFNSGSKVNVINLNYARKLDLKIRKTSIKA